MAGSSLFIGDCVIGGEVANCVASEDIAGDLLVAEGCWVANMILFSALELLEMDDASGLTIICSFSACPEGEKKDLLKTSNQCYFLFQYCYV